MSGGAAGYSMEDNKIENSLELSLQLPEEQREKSSALSSGFSPESGKWEVILRITGQIETLAQAFPEAEFSLLSGGYVIGRIPQEQIAALTDLEQVIYVEQPKRLSTQVEQGRRAACITPVQREETPTGRWTGRGVFVALIDSGIDYFHPDFRNEDGTSRIAWLYDDGVEYSNAQINEALARPTREEAYRLVPSRDLSGHGTHVAGIAAGNGRASQGANRGVAYESSLIVVKLGNARPGGFPKTTQLMEAVEYVRQKAQAANMPVAVNISFGNSYGSHTGTSLLEGYLSQAAEQWKMSLVAGSGNEGASGLHYQASFSSGGENARGGFYSVGSQTVELAVGPGEPTLNLQIWKNYQDELRVELVTPDGSELLLLEPGGAANGWEGTNRVVSYRWRETEIYVFPGTPAPYSIYQEIYVSFLPEKTVIDSGIWRIRLTPEQIRDGRYAMWLPSGGVLNEQTGFLQPSPDTTLTIPSTAEKVITVGAYDSRRNRYAAFSGRGFTWDREQIKPDLVAPGVDILSCAVGGGYVLQSGTSMATPFVTGSAALLMQWGIVEGNDPFAYGEKLKAYLLRGAVPLPGEEMPSRRTGWGKLCLENAVPWER